MTTKVHILATCLDQALLPNTLLVFRSLRIGFPTGQFVVGLNDLRLLDALQVRRAAPEGTVCYNTSTTHDAWIEQLLYRECDPFWVVDTDVVFSGLVQDWPVPEHFTGRLEPAFHEEWTRTMHVERLHTALMLFNPVPLRSAMGRWLRAGTPEGFPFVPETQFVRQQHIPVRDGETLFYDTCAGLYQAGLGTPFTAEQNAQFAHLHCGTYANRISRTSSLSNLSAVHRQVWKDPSQAPGLLAAQEQYYESRKA
jgi:hypothetical protein